MKRHGLILSVLCVSIISGCANNNSQSKDLTEKPKVEVKSLENIHSVILSVKKNERFLDGLYNSLSKRGIDQIAWMLPEKDMIRFRSHAINNVDFSGLSLNDAFSKMADNLGVRANLHYHLSDNVAAVVSWDGETEISIVEGEHLKEALKNISKDYSWNWIEDGKQGQSYLATSNYNFPYKYPLATKKGDFGQAISSIISAYPVRAELNENNRTVTILDAK
ncbi:hypothetical protein ABT56_18820 [Photobacterium aquae]|uniref:Uncharacterized protein n=1 Tax=Photobacterium aquae TaxID=1195763 RepID=A0A0J1GUS6_9GAMM|nr:hypothetical protein [Photobacterium aquae]KLV03490.1 hypothetical protein ABT56_18820 [Photobacterium aquae]